MELDEINGYKTIRGIIGNPIGHSLSPEMHNAAFNEMGLNYEYYKFEIEIQQLQDTLERMKTRRFRGLNVTIPFKIEVMKYLDSIDESARTVGAVNTIVNDDDKLTGFNTDIHGALEAMRTNGINPHQSLGKILILGAGGAARAVAFGLGGLQQELIIINRTFERGNQLAKELSRITSAIAIQLDELSDVINDVEVVINTTSMCMLGSESDEETPISSQLLREDMTVFDIVYNPKETKLLKSARAAGAKIIYGYEMLVHQGAKSFELWTGQKAPVELMKKVVLENLEKLETEPGGK
jgi:shikimate dehydrogenase